MTPWRRKGAKLTPVNPGDDVGQGLFLVGHQGQGRLFQGQGRIIFVGPEAGPILQNDQAPAGQALQAVAATGKEELELFHRGGAGFLKVSQEPPGLDPQALKGLVACGGLRGAGPDFPARLGGDSPPGDDEVQRLTQGILIVIRHPAEQGDQLRAKPGYGVEDLPDVPERPGRGLGGGAQEISHDLAAAHRHPHQAAHLCACGRKGRRQAISQGVGQGQSHRNFPQGGGRGCRFCDCHRLNL